MKKIKIQKKIISLLLLIKRIAMFGAREEMKIKKKKNKRKSVSTQST
jgi:hypothetical protein